MNSEKRNFYESINLSIKISIALILLQLIGQFYELGHLGILPREVSGIKGIFLAPLVHADWAHLFANLPPLVFTIILIKIFHRKLFTQILALSYLLTGFSVWLFAKPNIFHIGASGVVYALVSFIFWTGIFVKNTRTILLSLLVIFLYSGMFAGILPTTEILMKNISWQSHLYGGIIGIIMARVYKYNIIQNESQESPIPSSNFRQEEHKSKIFPPDLFQKTKWERISEEENNHRN